MLPCLGGRWGGQQPDPSPCPQKRHGDRDVTWGVPWVASPTTPMGRSQAKIAEVIPAVRKTFPVDGGVGSRAIGLSKLAARAGRQRGTTRLVGLPHPVGPSSPVQDCTQQPCNRGLGKMAWLDRGPTATKLRGDEVPWPFPCRPGPGLLAAVWAAT